jgi:hypothetical protein
MMAALFALAFGSCSVGSSNIAAVPTATGADIQLSVDRARYGLSQPIGVTVKNTSSSATYYAIDGRSGCTFLQLQMYAPANKTWVAVDGCSNDAQPFVRQLPPAVVEPFTLPPGTATNDSNSWASGVYRVALQFSSQQDGGGTPQVAYSAGFQIQ